jgi:biopolymer transport protein ExbB
MNYLFPGGFFVWPIVLESILALWVIIERTIYVLTVLPGRRKGLAELGASMGESSGKVEIPSGLGDFGEAVRTALGGRTLNLSLLATEGERMVREVEKGLVLLQIVAQSAPLIGLLGTITGMIKVLIVAESQSAAGQQIGITTLAGGIWEGLICTAAGLIAGIPSLVAYLAFNQAADSVAGEIDGAIAQVARKATEQGMEVLS